LSGCFLLALQLRIRCRKARKCEGGDDTTTNANHANPLAESKIGPENQSSICLLFIVSTRMTTKQKRRRDDADRENQQTVATLTGKTDKQKLFYRSDNNKKLREGG